MSKLFQHAKGLAAGRDGFVLPVVIFALVIMSTVAVVVLRTSVDEQHAARAVRTSAEAFYAAEAGVSTVWAEWNDTTQALDSLSQALAPGDSLVVGSGWRTLPNGDSYRAVLMRLDTSGQRLYLLTVEGRDQNRFGQSPVHLVLSPIPGKGTMTLGTCCDAAVIMRGAARIRQGTEVSGIDTDPPVWEANGDCPDSLQNKPGLLMKDTTVLSLEAPGVLNGVPPKALDATMSDSTFDTYGDLNWAEVKAKANHTIGIAGTSKSYSWGGDPSTSGSKYGPTYNADGSCNTANPLNWGSINPSSRCYNYFPIILVRGDVNLKDVAGYAQGVFILDMVAGVGSELDLEGVRFAGLIIGLGCVEVQYGSQFTGAIFVDGNYYGGTLCSPDPPLHTNHYSTSAPPAKVRWSSCVVQRTLEKTGLAAASGGVTYAGARKLPSRAFAQMLR